MASVEAINVPAEATSLHLKVTFNMDVPDVKFLSSETTVSIAPADVKSSSTKASKGTDAQEGE